jgi:OmpA-OmpF porin, OOP family
MFKKTVLVAALALGLSGVAFASGEEVAMPAAPAPDFVPGIYVGIQGLYGLTGWDNLKQDTTTSETINPFSGVVTKHTHSVKVDDENGFGGRVFLGYDFHKNFAVEAGYAYFGNTAKIMAVEDGKEAQLAGIKTSAFDLVGKAKIPVSNGFGIYAKAGVGYLQSKGFHDNVINDLLHIDTGIIRESDSESHVGLVYGLGVSYDITPNIITDLSWTRYDGNPSLKDGDKSTFKDYQPNLNTFGLAIAYKFNIQ